MAKPVEVVRRWRRHIDMTGAVLAFLHHNIRLVMLAVAMLTVGLVVLPFA